jgi:phage antirepressor YoqD-like protein
VLDAGYWMLDAGYWILDGECWMRILNNKKEKNVFTKKEQDFKTNSRYKRSYK